MAMSDKIEAFITELLKEDSPEGLEIGRNELAGIFNCVPSQINYVISTRFSPDKGYIVESRRGGGGYIRIKKVAKEPFEYKEQIMKNIGEEITAEKAESLIHYLAESGTVTKREKDIMLAACGDSPGDKKTPDKVRAKILKNILKKIM